jgi:protein-S-isoprenylcysteine O-methyltransferase Ste14
MKPAHPQPKQGIEDVGTPTLLLVAAVAVLAGVVAVVVAGSTGTAWAVVLALVIVVAGLVAVSATMVRQMDDGD